MYVYTKNRLRNIYQFNDLSNSIIIFHIYKIYEYVLKKKKKMQFEFNQVAMRLSNYLTENKTNSNINIRLQ